MISNKVDEGGVFGIFRHLFLLTKDTGQSFGFLEFAHIETNHAVWRAEQEFREGFGNFRLTRARWPDKKKDTLRSRWVSQTGLDHGNTLHQAIYCFLLTEYTCVKEVAQGLQIQPLPVIQNAGRQTGKLGEGYK